MAEFYTSVNRYGNNILYRGYNSAGKPVQDRVKFSPTLYIRSSGKPTEHTTIEGSYLEPKKFETMKEAKDFVEVYEGVEDFEIHGNTNYVTQFIYEKFPGEIPFNLDFINTCTIDIEVMSDDGFPYPENARHELISIAMKMSRTNTYYVWGIHEYDNSENSNVLYVQCDDERQMLLNFLDYWSSHTPDILTGWNSRLFDIPYLVNRINLVLGEEYSKKLSPWGLVSQKEIVIKGKKYSTFEIAGIQQLDYYDLFQKFGYTYGAQESYKLDHIAYIVLGERKLSYEEASTLNELYKTNYQKFIDYNIRDVYLVDRLEDKLGLISLALTMAYKAGVNYTDTFGTTMIWETAIYRDLMSRNVVPPPTVEKSKSNLVGAYVKDPQVGLHNWVCSFDLNSLYPNIIVQWNMSPETIVEESDTRFNVDSCLSRQVRATNPEYTVAANGSMYRKNRMGIIPSLVRKYYDDRKTIKKKMIEAKQELEVADKEDKQRIYSIERDIARYENQQMAIKILLNSLYGAIGNRHFKYFDIRVAEAITTTGQLAIQWAERAMNKKLNSVLKTDNFDYVIAIDTDSLYVNFGPLIEKCDPKNKVDFLDSICSDTFEKELRKAYSELSDAFNCYENRMEMKRESIADVGIWTAKKRYILNVFDNEGVRYAEPKLKIMGIEAIKSSTPSACREALKELFKVIVSGSEAKTQKAIRHFKQHFSTLPPEEVSFPRGVSDIDKWRDRKNVYKKATPIHVRGALLHNELLKSKGLEKKYQEIKSGDKIKFCYLKMPNPLKENVISFIDYLPQEFQLSKYVDNDVQFEKTFIKPITPILEAIGWKAEESVSVEDFFT